MAPVFFRTCWGAIYGIGSCGCQQIGFQNEDLPSSRHHCCRDAWTRFILVWVVLSDGQRGNGWAFSLLKWPANEQQGEGWAPTSGVFFRVSVVLCGTDTVWRDKMCDTPGKAAPKKHAAFLDMNLWFFVCSGFSSPFNFQTNWKVFVGAGTWRWPRCFLEQVGGDPYLEDHPT